MPQITLYLDDGIQALIEQAAQAQGVSKSRWVADLIRKHAAHEWPQECLNLAGRFADFPLRDDVAALPADLPRIGF
ncbi:MAG TPA: CopG family transcriptional regulator [Alicycliphilus sp.]|nr:CopG family transcriptional regulator [Alicycliphilus sp.]